MLVTIAVRDVVRNAAHRAGAAACAAGDNVSGNKRQCGAQQREAGVMVVLDLHDNEACFGRALNDGFVSPRDVGGLQDAHIFRYDRGVGIRIEWGSHCRTIRFKNVW